eukprot:3893188-Rhodomonas_salina.2
MRGKASVTGPPFSCSRCLSRSSPSFPAPSALCPSPPHPPPAAAAPAAQRRRSSQGERGQTPMRRRRTEEREERRASKVAGFATTTSKHSSDVSCGKRTRQRRQLRKAHTPVRQLQKAHTLAATSAAERSHSRRELRGA